MDTSIPAVQVAPILTVLTSTVAGTLSNLQEYLALSSAFSFSIFSSKALAVATMSASDLVVSSTTSATIFMNSGSPAFLASPTTGALPLRNATNWLAPMLTFWPSCSMSIAPLLSEPTDWPFLVTPTIPSVPRIEQVAVPVLNLNELPSFCF